MLFYLENAVFSKIMPLCYFKLSIRPFYFISVKQICFSDVMFSMENQPAACHNTESYLWVVTVFQNPSYLN